MNEYEESPVETSDLIDQMEHVMPKFQHVVKHILTRIQGEDRLTLQQLRSLRAIAASETGMPTIALARHLNSASPTVTRIVDGLVDRGLVDRRTDEVDRRRSRLVLAGPGAELLTEYEDALHRHLASRLADITPDRRLLLREALTDLDKMLREPDRITSDAVSVTSGTTQG